MILTAVERIASLRCSASASLFCRGHKPCNCIGQFHERLAGRFSLSLGNSLREIHIALSLLGSDALSGLGGVNHDAGTHVKKHRFDNRLCVYLIGTNQAITLECPHTGAIYQ